MATTSSVVFNATSTLGKELTKSLTNINRNAGAGTLDTFASKLNALTTNDYDGATRIDKTDLDDTTVKTAPTLSLAQTSISFADVKAACQTAPYGLLVDINYNGDGKVYAKHPLPEPEQTIYYCCGHKVVYVDGAPKLFLNTVADTYNTRDFVYTGAVAASETDAFAAAEVTFTITA